MCDALVSLLGDKLKTSSGEVSTSDALSTAKAVALYFSAHWCPPCRGFTPELAKAYDAHLKAKGLEVVFVSSDKDEAAFEEYFAEQPWLALPYANRDAKEALSKKYKVRGIPTLVILDGATGETITTDGREAVGEDPEGRDFPWKPPAFFDALGDEFLTGTDGETVSLAEVQARAQYIGLYFSAHWCPPCRGFTPELIKAYDAHLKAKGLEIIFCSSDKDQAAFLSYFAEMPWLAIPNGDARKAQLSKRFGVSGIPSLVIVDAKSGETVTTSARRAVGADPEGADFPWMPKALCDMAAGEGVDSINDEVALCAMLEGCDAETVAAAKAVLTPLADASKAAGKPTLFLIAPKEGGPTEQIRKLTKIGAPGKTPALVLLDVPDGGGFYVSPATEVSVEAVTALLEKKSAAGKALDRQQLG